MKIQKLKVANIQSYRHHDNVIHADNTVRKEVAKAGNTDTRNDCTAYYLNHGPNHTPKQIFLNPKL